MAAFVLRWACTGQTGVHAGSAHANAPAPGVGSVSGSKQLSLPVLLMSGFMSEVEQERIDAVGALLPKPFTPSALASKVREVLDGATAL